MRTQTADEPSHPPEWRWSAFSEINVYFRHPVMAGVRLHKTRLALATMTLRTIVGFVAAFPSDRDADDSPAGRLLAEFVTARLMDAGIQLVGPREREGWAWDVSANVDGIAIDTIVGLVDDMDSSPPRQWLITNDATIGVWNRLFASRAKRDQSELSMRRYCEAIHRILVSDDRFSHILWYNKQTFDRPGDEPGATP